MALAGMDRNANQLFWFLSTDEFQPGFLTIIIIIFYCKSCPRTFPKFQGGYYNPISDQCFHFLPFGVF